MTDDDENKEKIPDHSEDFEEEFDFDDEDTAEDILAVESENEGQPEEMISTAPPRKSNAIPFLIGLTVFGFIGWKIYGMITGPKTPETTAQAEKETPAPEKSVASQEGLPPASTEKVTAPKETPVAQSAPTVTPESMMAPPPAQVATAQPMQQAPAMQSPPPNNSNLMGMPTQQPSAVTPQEMPVAALPTQPSVPQVPINDQDPLSRLQKELNDQEQLSKQQFAVLERNLSIAAQNSANTNRSMAALEQEIMALSNTISDLALEIKSIRQEQSKVRSSAQAAKNGSAMKAVRIESNPSLSIHAIIPGRAWLKGSDGKLITVAEGDPAGEYGKVLKIDAANGIVVTTSGVTLR